MQDEFVPLIDPEDRYEASQRHLRGTQGFSSTDEIQGLIQKNFGMASEALKEALSDPQRRVKEIKELLGSLDLNVVTLAVLYGMFDSIAEDEVISKTFMRITRVVYAQAFASGLMEFDEKAAKRIEKLARQKHASAKVRQTAAKAMAKKAGYMQPKWSDEDRMKLGAFCLDVMVNALPNLFGYAEETIEGHRGPIQATYLTITDEAREEALKIYEAVLKNYVVRRPMTEQPQEWTSMTNGGFIEEIDLANSKLVRRPLYQKELGVAVGYACRSGTMSPALAAINRVQSVAWKIDPVIREAVLWVYNSGRRLKKGLPPKEDFQQPAPIDKAVWETLSPEQRKVAIRLREGIKKRNRGLIGRRTRLLSDLHLSEDLGDKVFFIPHNLDFRGRIYGMTSFQFQREDRVRAMFRFAEGKPIGERGLYWLMIHTANCGDFKKVSKAPYSERVSWVRDNLQKIHQVAADYRCEADWWCNADKPFLFLAACRELSAALKEGPSFVTHLPVSWDGSCSGVQHLTAMMRSVEGRYVNLLDSEQPQDLYQAVADVVVEKIKGDLNHEDPTIRLIAQRCMDYGIGRSDAKRNVMTYAYSSKPFGMGKQQVEDLMKPLEDQVYLGNRPEHPFGTEEEYGRAARYIAKKCYDSIQEVVKAPAEAMEFLQKCARALAHEGKYLQWNNPVGFPLLNQYMEHEENRVKLYMYDKGVRFAVQPRLQGEATKTVDKAKVANSVAPNVVHSLDSAHLMRVVNAAFESGIRSMALVHDSFGCLAPDSDDLHKIIREEFVRMYSEHDVLQEIHDATLNALTDANKEKVPEVPQKGSLDINEVLNATYAFA